VVAGLELFNETKNGTTQWFFGVEIAATADVLQALLFGAGHPLSARGGQFQLSPGSFLMMN
jgi:hypothetical protein